MYRQLIGQVQELLQLYDGGSPPPPDPFFLNFHPNTPLFQPPPFPQHQPPPQQSRWCFLNLDDSSPEDDCCSAIMMGDRNREKLGYFKMLEPGKPPPTKNARRNRNRVRLNVIDDPTEVMNEQIWKDFPQDLYEAVIARLPIAIFFRFRSVCRKWDSLLTCQSFLQQCAQVPQATQPWFYTLTHENVYTGVMYDPTLKQWHHPNVPAFPTKSIVFPVASAGGLVCFLDVGHRSFYVSNPLTRSFKELPPRSVKVWSRIAVGMILNDKSKSTSGGYKILWVGCDGEFEIYNSKKNTWTRPGIMPSSIKLPLSLNFRSQVVCIDSVLYFMRSEPDGIVCYDMMTGVWKQFTVPVPLNLSDHTLAEFEGRIMLVGLLTKNAATCLYVWELQKMTLLWKEVDRMPNLWCLEFYGKHVRMTCLGNNGLLMLSLRSRQMNRMVMYDISKREWLKVTSCALPGGRKWQWISCGTAFHPCLAALP